jgi:hypothetical protein
MLRTKIIMIFLTLVAVFALTAPSIALAQDAKSQLQCGVNAAAGEKGCGAGNSDINTPVGKIVNLLSSLVGVLAVIMLIVGGFRYVTSGGNQESTKNARNTIIYALVGLVVVALAQIIVRFVLSSV